MDERERQRLELLERVSAEYDEGYSDEGTITSTLIEDVRKELADFEDAGELRDLLAKVDEEYDDEGYECCGVIPQELVEKIRTKLGRCEGCGLKRMNCLCQLRD